jgi:hypothetical protein
MKKLDHFFAALPNNLLCLFAGRAQRGPHPQKREGFAFAAPLRGAKKLDFFDLT